LFLIIYFTNLIIILFSKANPCRAAVIEHSNGSFELSTNAHNHPADPGAAVSAAITATVKAKAAADVFRPVSAIVEEVLPEQMTDAPCSSLPRPEYIGQAANRKRHVLVAEFRTWANLTGFHVFALMHVFAKIFYFRTGGDGFS